MEAKLQYEELIRFCNESMEDGADRFAVLDENMEELTRFDATTLRQKNEGDKSRIMAKKVILACYLESSHRNRPVTMEIRAYGDDSVFGMTLPNIISDAVWESHFGKIAEELSESSAFGKKWGG